MARPRQCRWVDALPRTMAFKPSGLQAVVSLSPNEFGALRLADHIGKGEPK